MLIPWTEKGARAKSRRKLKSLKRKVTEMAGDVAYEWGDVDQSIVVSCDELIGAVSKYIEEIEDYMSERVEDAKDGDQMRFET